MVKETQENASGAQASFLSALEHCQDSDLPSLSLLTRVGPQLL